MRCLLALLLTVCTPLPAQDFAPNCGLRFEALSKDSIDHFRSSAHTPSAQEYAAYWHDNIRRSLFGRGPLNYPNLPTERLLYSHWKAADRRFAAFKELGFRFSANDGKLEMQAPTLQTYVQNYEALLAKSGLAEQDKIRPGRAYRVGDSPPIFRGVLEPVPEGAVEIHMSSSPQLIGDMMAAGYFPLSHNWRSWHDSCHLTSFVNSPEYMKGMRRMARGDVGWDNRPPGGDMEVRFVYLLEGMALIPASRKAELTPLLSPSLRGQQAGVPTVAQVEAELSRLSPAELQAHADRLLEEVPKLFDHYGFFEPGTMGQNAGLSDALPHVLVDLAKLREPERPHRSFTVGPEHLRRAVARLEVAALLSTDVTVEGTFEELQQVKANPQGPVYKMIVTSGLGLNESIDRYGLADKPRSPLYDSLTEGRERSYDPVTGKRPPSTRTRPTQ